MKSNIVDNIITAMTFYNYDYYSGRLYSFCELPVGGFDPSLRKFSSVKARGYCLVQLVKKSLFLPIFLIAKALVSVLRAGGVVLGAFFVIVSFRSSEKAERFFLRRLSFFARDLGDWILAPLTIIKTFGSLLLGLACPILYFR